MKAIIAAALVSFASVANAQYSKKISLTVKGGVNAAHYSLPKDPTFNDPYADAGKTQNFQLGVLVNFPLSKELDLQTGLLLNGKGGKVSISQPYFLWETSDTKSLYLEMPINFVYNIPISKSFGLHVGAGPYIAMGVGGKNRYEGVIGDLLPQSFNEESNIKYGKKDGWERGIYSNLNKYDYGMNFMLGASFKQVQLYSNYGLGFKDVQPNPEERYDMGRNRVLSVGLGYTFKW